MAMAKRWLLRPRTGGHKACLRKGYDASKREHAGNLSCTYGNGVLFRYRGCYEPVVELWWAPACQQNA
jgi:hypothetical protein